jgi:hypothetical protein
MVAGGQAQNQGSFLPDPELLNLLLDKWGQGRNKAADAARQDRQDFLDYPVPAP